jgi:hypothetical protein
MADWTNIPDATFDPDRPVLGSTHLAIVKNFEALAEGAVNAPRITNSALVAPTAGSNIIFRLQDATANVSATSYFDVGLHDRFLSGSHLGVTVLISGVIRCSLEHRMVDATSSSVRIVKNGVQVQEFTTSSTSFVLRQVDVSVATGDQIIFQAISSGGNNATQWRSLRVLSGTITAAVA